MPKSKVKESLAPPEFTFRDHVYRFNTDMTLAAMDILSELIHDSRKKVIDALMIALNSQKKSETGFIDPTIAFTFQVDASDLYHEISRAGKSSRFVAACVAATKEKINELEKLFETLPVTHYESMFSFFCDGGPLLKLVMPGSSNVAPEATDTIPLED